MKHTLTILTIILCSQMGRAQEGKDDYDILWKEVQHFEQEALPKSALEVVGTISNKAKKEHNSAQIIKSLLYTSKYALTLEEDAQLKVVLDFKEEISKAEFPTRNILDSYLAKLYWQYFQQNRYQFYGRTKTEAKVDPTDFRTWDLTTLFEEISIHLDASLANTSGLQLIPVRDFATILNEQPDSEIYRPTLFDLLAHTALEFYKTDEPNITRPADKFEIDGPELFCDPFTFMRIEIDTTDHTAMQPKALLLYQQLLKFHVPDAIPYPFIEVDLERLQFIYTHTTVAAKDAQYLEVLNNIISAMKGGAGTDLYLFEIAALYRQQGNTYQPKVQAEHRWRFKEALTLCDSVIGQYPGSRGADKCKALKSQIMAKELQLATEQYIAINSPARLLVTYKNHTDLQLTAYKISAREIKTLNGLYPQSKQLAFIQKRPVHKNWEASLTNEKDYQSHSTEILVPPLDNGQYVLLAIPQDGSQSFAYSTFQATNLALITTRTPENHLFQVVDRDNGKPVMDAQLQFSYQKNYDGPYLKKNRVSDKMGMVNISLTKEHWNNVGIIVTHGKDTAQFGEFYVYEKQATPDPAVANSCFLFTDRSIYRPGQPLYFKGIALQNAQGVSSILENLQISVVLQDVNGQIVGTQEFKTNAFGSFSGEFILPSNGLSGEFSLQASSKSKVLNGYTSFSVEEYKRPKFETSLDPIMETYAVDDRITVKGKATAYAGSNITDAKVTYTVRRTVYFPRWYYWRHPYYPIAPQEIAHGETVTDASGGYTIPFKALADKRVPKENLPTFSYDVTADVTDINGETHSTSAIVTVGYHMLTANIHVGDLLDKDLKTHQLSISTSNLNGQFVPANGTLKMYKLRAPDQVLRPRPWAAPDYRGFERSKFMELFPHDAFENEHDPSTWQQGALVWEADFDSEKSKEIKLESMKKWPSGAYVIELETEDKTGQAVRDIVQTVLFSNRDQNPADNSLFQIKTDKDTYAVGEKVEITLSSGSDDLSATVFVEKDRKIIDTRILHLNKNSMSFTVPVTAKDMGGFSINYSFSAYNAFQTGSLPIDVPYPRTDLEIETVTFRDKLQPGTEETWSFKIKGPKGEKVAAELLASMYDVSLDAFRTHNWNFQPLINPTYYSNSYSNASESYGVSYFNVYQAYGDTYSHKVQGYDTFDWFGLYFGYGRGLRMYKERALVNKSGVPGMVREDSMDMEDVSEVAFASNSPQQESTGGRRSIDAPLAPNQAIQNDKKTSIDNVKIRKNLQETAFFLPQLHTDKDGNVSFSFTTPEALTKWRLQLLAHTKTLESGRVNLNTQTQKELMVTPNLPRFLREGDEIIISSKIANLTGKSLAGMAKLVLTDALTGVEVTEQLLFPLPTTEEILAGAGLGEIAFTVDSLGNTQVSWRLKIPQELQALEYKIMAKAGDFSDGEQNVLPVLTNRMLVTETLPMWVGGNQSKPFTLDKLRSNTSTTLRNHKLTLEITSNPAWYAVQALPYLMEFPYECNEQTFSKLYANTLASHIANSNPRIQEVFDQWANSDALISNLEKNEDLKSLLIQETPWLRDARSESEQKKRIALLFDLNLIKDQQRLSLFKLKNNQMSSGAWAWFTGGRANRFITQHIITGLGHLQKLGATSNLSNIEGGIVDMTTKAIGYLDEAFVEEYQQMKKHATDLNDDHLSETQIHYLYMRSFFKEIKASKKVADIMAYYSGQAQKYWKAKGLYSKGMLALALDRMEDTNTSHKILRSLKEQSIDSEALGMYWKENTNSWHWYQAPIETQALLIEAFMEIDKDVETVDKLKIWLLKHKQTNQWKTTKATTEAVYALLLQGSDWLSVEDAVTVLVGGEKITPAKLENVKVEAGTGYYKTAWSGKEVSAEMAAVQLTKKGKGIAWGALYWQYFENLDKITAAETPLKLQKKLFLKKNTDTGEEIFEITDKTGLKVGDLIRVRIELRADRPMEFVHMKDMRAAGLEPINVISRYKWQDGLGYYESTRDASTNFFFDYLPKGVFVFEYDLRINNAGDFSNGITTVQSMYAPEFSSHSEGIRVVVVGGDN